MMTGPQADFWFPVNKYAATWSGQWYSENTMQGILAYRGQVTQALPGQTNRLVANIGDIKALGGYVNANEWNDYESDCPRRSDDAHHEWPTDGRLH